MMVEKEEIRRRVFLKTKTSYTQIISSNRRGIIIISSSSTIIRWLFLHFDGRDRVDSG